MPAVVEIMRWNGAAPGTPTKITGLNTRANAEDTNTPGSTTNPVQIPAAGTTNYSYWVATRLQCTQAPANGIANLRWYAPNANNFNAGIGCIGNEASTYVMATGVAGTGNQLNIANYGNTLTAPLDVFVNFKQANPKSLQGSIGAVTGDIGNWFVYQITVAGTGTLPGSSGQTTFTWMYDET